MRLQWRRWGKKEKTGERWNVDGGEFRRLLLEERPDLRPLWLVVDSDDEPLSELKKKLELEQLVEEELRAEAAQSTSASH